MTSGRIRTVALVGLLAAVLVSPTPAPAAVLCDEVLLSMSDGVRLYGLVSRLAPDAARPVILTLSTYGLPVPNQGVPLSHQALCGGPAVDQQVVDEEAAERFTRVIFHIRGSGASEGLWDMMGPRTQRDVDEVIDWVSRQPWSNGDVLLFGMSGPALFTFYGLDHPAVKAAVVESTCSDFYRACTRHGGGLMEVGHGFMGLVEAAYSASLPLRFRRGLDRNPTPAEQVAALAQSNVDFASHDLYDDWHAARSSHRLLPDVRIPVFFTTDPYDIIPASMYDAYQMTPGARLSLGKGHTTPTAGRLPSLLQGPINRFVRHYMLGEDNGAESEAPVTLLLNLGSRADYASADKYT